MSLPDSVKWLLFPGLNLNARLRRRMLPRFLGAATAGMPKQVLDAGCGNGALAYASYLRGNTVLAVSIKQGEIERNIRLFNGRLGISTERLRFEVLNLYELSQLKRTFDEIICTEVLEHIKDDARVCQYFWDALELGGSLHLCCPNAAHPLNRAEGLDAGEAGGHVRAGYTLESYRALLEPIGFSIGDTVGLGGPVRQFWNRLVIASERRWGRLAAGVVFLAAQPFLWLDPEAPRMPYSLYVRAVKPSSVGRLSSEA